jgi:hypothetical protein
MPAFDCRFVSKTIRKWQKLATPHMCGVASHEKSQRMKPWRVSCAGFVANKTLLLMLGLTLQQLEHSLLRGISLSQHRSGCLLHDLRTGQLG